MAVVLGRSNPAVGGANLREHRRGLSNVKKPTGVRVLAARVEALVLQSRPAP
jgi:hypothetical protein